ncbi:MAG: dienelactone hydrolase family protein [Chloroflexota bacterium]
MTNVTAPATTVRIDADGARLTGDLVLPSGAGGIVAFGHGSGSSRLSPRNRSVAEALNEAGLATLLIDLLTPDEDATDQLTRELRFDIALLARRLTAVVDEIARGESLPKRIGLFGASTGAAAALIAAADRPALVRAVVSRGGRPDLAGDALERVMAPTLLIVGGADPEVLALNRSALQRLGTRMQELHIVPGATHLFEEPGALEAVARLAAVWFQRHLAR